MVLKGRVDTGGERLSLSLKANKIGPWLLVSIKKDVRQNFVDSSTPELVDIDFRIPGFNLADGRSGWIFNGETKTVEVFAKARLFSSAPRSAVYLVLVADADLPKLSERENVSRFGTFTERLEVSTMWRNVTLVGELFVIPTARGYVPAVLARMPSGELRHLIVGSSSLSQGIEDIRSVYGKIDGQAIAVRKTGTQKYSTYVVLDNNESESYAS